jgi:hypothetical protein
LPLKLGIAGRPKFSTSKLPRIAPRQQGREAECQARLLALDGRWFRCVARHVNDGPFLVSKAMKGIAGGMSGSPIVADDGSAIASYAHRAAAPTSTSIPEAVQIRASSTIFQDGFCVR